MEATSERERVAERLGATVRRHLGSGAWIEGLRVAVGGGSNRTWTYDVALASGERMPMVLRQNTLRKESEAGGFDAVFRTPELQYRVMKRAHAAGVPVPRLHFLLEPEDDLGSGFAMERVEGETIPRRILRGERTREALPRMAEQCGEILARIQEVAASDLAELPRPAGGASPARDAVLTQRDLLDRFGEPHPVLELAFHWLLEHLPEDEPVVLVHGDFRNGNWIVGAEGIRAVLDWELCHLGSPIEDIGWLCAKSWRYGVDDRPVGGFGLREDLYAAYERATGRRVQPAAVAFWEVFALVRWAMLNILLCYGHVSGANRLITYAACGRNTSEPEWDLVEMLEALIR